VGREFGRAGTLRRVEQEFWKSWSLGVPIPVAAAGCGVAATTAKGWVRRGGGVRPRHVGAGPGARSRALCEAEREEIALGLAAGRSMRDIARQLGRAPSTISREVTRNRLSRVQAVRDHAAAGGRGSVIFYRAGVAQFRAEARRRRPKDRRLAVRPDLARVVEDKLVQRWSPRQIAASLRRAHPDRPELRVSHETIYQCLYVQGRGGLRRELHAALRTGRALRHPRGAARGGRRGGITGAISISERPAEAGDRAVPGHWEGDLIVGKDGRSAIGTLVERSTRYCLLLHLPDRHGAEQVRDAMITTIATLPEHLWRSLTWDRGTEMARHYEITIATGLPVYFADPHSPWQRGSNENTNGLLRQYFPKGTDLSVHSRQHLDAVAVQLNGRPRETLDWASPAQAMNQLLSEPFNTNGVAFTP
jgi:IS30 family transposase